MLQITLPETNIDIENGWLEDDPFLWETRFSGAQMLVLERVEG